MTILCISRPKVKPTRRSPRPARPFGEGILEPSLEPAAITSCRIVENDRWSEDRDAGVDKDACRYHLQMFVGDRMVAEERGFSLREMEDLAQTLLPGADVPVIAKAIAPRRPAQHTAADERWWMLVSLGVLPPISGGAPQVDDRYDADLERLASDYEATDRLERGLDASGAFIGHDE